MGLTADQIARHCHMIPHLRQQARTLVEIYDGNPRLSAVFATQQRWLMAHIALALYFRRDASDLRRGFTVAQFIEKVRGHAVASRNTADAFAQEMLKYQFIRNLPSGIDRRTHPVEMTETSLDAIAAWIALHLATLDGMDGGDRAAAFAKDPEAAGKLEPLIAEGLLTRQTIREPSGTFSLFAWLDKGGVVMERIISGIADVADDVEHIPTEVASVTEIAQWLGLSRTHLVRKLKEAEAMDSIGWSGKRNQSAMWVSRGFLQEIVVAQATKLAVIDAAFEASHL